ncbi:ROK family protein [Limosilactobacillus sp. STM2_1]|uniref:ROK family protein n=1 Tax=Limosilactobacillus rudii TaxID=2759755 RepID=A0A7W3UKZ3_9LACO|nr:ROK family protein [Limosilactobacillus rudii]MBB1079480.1 ROK family protein [Limosilactobacillus rudii]MBB1097526.1 ROK family protein [Limosilactobacillus rudii]MCD7134636.1 ROK family protein [Limosilactobacillus rudii]
MQRQYLSIDIGGTEIKSALIDHSGNIFKKKHMPTPRQKEDFLGLLFATIDEVVDKITAVCISVPGIVNPAIGNVEFTGALGFMGHINLAAYIESRISCPVYVGNDANCATLAEMWLGNLDDIHNGAVITLGTSIGGGIVINDQLIHGPHFQAGELSAMIIDHDAPKLHYSTMGATTSAVKMIETIADTCDLANKTDGRRVFKEITQRNPVAWSLFESFCHRIAVLILNMQTVVDLERVLIGGGISAQEILIEEIKHQFMLLQAGDYRLHDDVTMPEIMAAKFGNEANLLGALYGLLLKIE